MRKQLCQRETQMLVAPWAPVCKGSLAFAVMWLVLLAASPGRGDVIEYTPLSLTNIVFTTHTSYGSATNEVYWPAQNHEQVHDQTQAEAEAAVVTGTESGRVERSVTHTWSRSFGGLNRRYFADYLREDQELEFYLSHLGDSDGAYRAVFEWPMKYDDGVNDINWLDAGAANVMFIQTVPVGQDTTDLDPITLEPTWTEYNSGTYFAGYGAREPTLVLESLTEEIPPCSVVPDRWWVSLGNPVNAITGNKSLERLDVSLPVPGLPLYLKREYHSLTPAGWTHNYQMSVTNKTSVFDGETNSWKVLHAGPVSMHFKDIGSGLYESPFGTRHELNVLTNGDTVVTFGSGQTARFASDGLVRELSDPFSNVLTVSYTNDATAGDVVSRVEHDNGLGLDFSYSSGRLSRVDLPSTNLYVTFTYNASGQVASVSRHFPDATYTESYGYEPSVDGAGHNLVRFTNGVGHVSHYEYQTNSAGQATSMATGSYVGSNRYLEVSVEYPTNGVASRTVALARDGEELQYEYVYHPGLGVLEAIIGPTGADDLRRRETRFEFDESGDRTAMVVGDWEISEWTRTEFAYNSQHQVTNIAHGYMTDSPTNAWIYTWHPNLDEISSLVQLTALFRSVLRHIAHHISAISVLVRPVSFPTMATPDRRDATCIRVGPC